MKKLSKIFAVALCLAMVLAILPMGAAAASETVTLDFSGLTQQGVEITDTGLEVFQKAGAGDVLTAVELTKVYDGNGTGGAFPNTAGFLKCGTGKVDGAMTLTFAKKVVKVEITCHDWYTKSDSYPTNSNTIAVNGGEAKLAPYTTDATMGVLSFDIAAANTVSIVLDNTGSSYGRAFISKMVVTFEEATQNPPAGGDNTQNPPAGGDNTQTPPAGGDTEKPDDAGDNTAIVAMTSVMAVAVVALAVLVIGKKRMF